MRCPQLDRLRSDLIEAYRRLEDQDLFIIADNPDARDDDLYLIYETITRHRDFCPVCNFKSITRDTTNILRQ